MWNAGRNQLPKGDHKRRRDQVVSRGKGRKMCETEHHARFSWSQRVCRGGLKTITRYQNTERNKRHRVRNARNQKQLQKASEFNQSKADKSGFAGLTHAAKTITRIRPPLKGL